MKTFTKSYIFKIFAIICLFAIHGCIDEIIVPKGNIKGRIFNEYGMPSRYTLISAGEYPIVSVDWLGNFELDDVNIPYDLTSSPEFSGSSLKYFNLSVPNPVIYDLHNFSAGAHSTITVNLPAFPLDKNAIIKFISNDNTLQYEDSFYSGEDSLVNITVYFEPDKSQVSGSLIYLEYSGSRYNPYSFDKFGMKDIVLQANGYNEVRFNPEDINYDPKEIESYYNIVVNENVEMIYSDFYLNLIDYHPSSCIALTSHFRDFNGMIKIPVLPQLRFNMKLLNGCSFSKEIAFSKKWVYFNPGENVSLIQKQTLNLITPEDDQKFITDNTVFVVNDLDTEFGIFIFTLTNSSSYLRLEFFTDKKEIKFRDFKTRGVKFKPGTEYFWSVRKYPGFESIDEFASVKVSEDNRYTSIPSSKTFSFTTAP